MQPTDPAAGRAPDRAGAETGSAVGTDPSADAPDNAMALLRTTVADEAQARRLARRLVEQRLACCVHFHAIASVYAWEGKVEEAHEWLVEARTPLRHADAVWDAMLDGHPYDTPLVERLPDALATARYARWAHGVTGA